MNTMMKVTITGSIAAVTAAFGLISGVIAANAVGNLVAPAAARTPSIADYVVPSTLHRLQATVEHTSANYDVLRKIGPGFAEGYQVTSATYTFTAPDRLEMHASAGLLSATQIYTNTTRRTDFGWIHKTDDISKDITKRQTIEGLGLLPQNYLEIMQSVYVGTDTVSGVACQVFMLRYITDSPTENRRFETWVSDTQHYIVKQRVWDGGNTEHQTVIYLNPIQAVTGVWVPTRVEVYDSEGELAGVAIQKDISAG
jgi:hypothetical protein